MEIMEFFVPITVWAAGRSLFLAEKDGEWQGHPGCPLCISDCQAFCVEISFSSLSLCKQNKALVPVSQEMGYWDSWRLSHHVVTSHCDESLGILFIMPLHRTCLGSSQWSSCSQSLSTGTTQAKCFWNPLYWNPIFRSTLDCVVCPVPSGATRPPSSCTAPCHGLSRKLPAARAGAPVSTAVSRRTDTGEEGGCPGDTFQICFWKTETFKTG